MGRPKHEVPAPEPSKRHWVTQAVRRPPPRRDHPHRAGHVQRRAPDRLPDQSGFVRYDLNEVDAALTPYGGSVSA